MYCNKYHSSANNAVRKVRNQIKSSQFFYRENLLQYFIVFQVFFCPQISLIKIGIVQLCISSSSSSSSFKVASFRNDHHVFIYSYCVVVRMFTQTDDNLLAQRGGGGARRPALLHVQDRQRAHQPAVGRARQAHHDQVEAHERGRIHTVPELRHEGWPRVLRAQRRHLLSVAEDGRARDRRELASLRHLSTSDDATASGFSNERRRRRRRRQQARGMRRARGGLGRRQTPSRRLVGHVPSRAPETPPPPAAAAAHAPSDQQRRLRDSGHAGGQYRDHGSLVPHSHELFAARDPIRLSFRARLSHVHQLRVLFRLLKGTYIILVNQENVVK